VTFPAGSKLWQHVVQREHTYFPDPERFDPQRFSESAKKTRPRFSYSCFMEVLVYALVTRSQGLKLPLMLALLTQ